MTRKDYVAIASALRRSRPMSADYEPHHMDQWLDDITVIGSVLAADNPRFDRARFETACGRTPNANVGQ